MTTLTKILVGSAGLAGLAVAGSAAAQYPYGYGYGYNSTQAAAERCTAAVQNRLSTRTGLSGILGSVFGANTTGRVLSVTQVNPRRNVISPSFRSVNTIGRSSASATA